MNCPFCRRLLYSRQHLKCGHCGGELPERYRLTEDEIEEMKAETKEILKRREIAKAKAEEELKEQKRRSD
jgi:hypothetical protein